MNTHLVQDQLVYFASGVESHGSWNVCFVSSMANVQSSLLSIYTSVDKPSTELTAAGKH